MVEVYRSVYHVRQRLLSLKEGLEIKNSAIAEPACTSEQDDSSDAEEQSTLTSSQTQIPGKKKQWRASKNVWF